MEYDLFSYFEQEPIAVAVANSAWNYATDDQTASYKLQESLEEEYGLPFGDTSIGTGAAEAGFLALIPSAAIGGAIWLFFKGKDIQPNIDAWTSLYKKYLSRFTSKDAFFDRGGSLVLAIMALKERIGKDPEIIRLRAYNKRPNAIDLDEIMGPLRIAVDDRERVERSKTHVFDIEADGDHYRIHVKGKEVTFIDD